MILDFTHNLVPKILDSGVPFPEKALIASGIFHNDELKDLLGKLGGYKRIGESVPRASEKLEGKIDKHLQKKRIENIWDFIEKSKSLPEILSRYRQGDVIKPGDLEPEEYIHVGMAMDKSMFFSGHTRDIFIRGYLTKQAEQRISQSEYENALYYVTVNMALNPDRKSFFYQKARDQYDDILKEYKEVEKVIKVWERVWEKTLRNGFSSYFVASELATLYDEISDEIQRDGMLGYINAAIRRFGYKGPDKPFTGGSDDYSKLTRLTIETNDRKTRTDLSGKHILYTHGS